MKKIILFISVWLCYSCNNQSTVTTEAKSDTISNANKPTSTFEKLQEEIKKREENPAYKDSMDREVQKMAEKWKKQADEKYSKYTLEDWVETYRYGLENNLLIKSSEVKYNANYEPTLYLTINNWGGIGIVSMEFLAGNNSPYNSNTFIVKKAIPPRTTVNISVKISEAIANLPISVYSAISSTGDKFYCASARTN